MSHYYQGELDAVAEAMADRSPEFGYCNCGRHASDQCDLCVSLVAGVDEPVQSAEEQIERRADFIIRELDEFCGLANNPETIDLIESQSIAIGQMNTRIKIILDFLNIRLEPKGLRLVKGSLRG